ncbi:MAG: hypothetical protein GIW99_09510 [Candidatus Eremiobacteraeota bacterium]|nr:hypothetical protein [Candidatus Eremiobacteraeota bacterium]MBC5827898.1 hypothetical protein [Candidatus Eremiobacteraeota bacterium]
MRTIAPIAAGIFALVLGVAAARADVQMGRYIATGDASIRVDAVATVSHAETFLPSTERPNDGYAIVSATISNRTARRVHQPTYLFSFSLRNGGSFGGRYESDVLGPYVAASPIASLSDAPETLAPSETRSVRYIVLNWPRRALEAMTLSTSLGVSLKGSRVGQLIPDYTESDVPLGNFFSIGDVDLRVDQVTSHRRKNDDAITHWPTNQDGVNGYFVAALTERNAGLNHVVIPNYVLALDFNDGPNAQSRAYGPFSQRGSGIADRRLGLRSQEHVSWLITNWVDEAPVVRLSVNPTWRFPLRGVLTTGLRKSGSTNYR